MGGGWRQAGFLAAAGIYALENNIQRLKEDHNRAKRIGEFLSRSKDVKSVYPVETNIVFFEVNDSLTAKEYADNLALEGIRCIPFGHQLIRMVTHLDFTEDDLEYLLTKL
jgi:threonine aldolase